MADNTLQEAVSGEDDFAAHTQELLQNHATTLLRIAAASIECGLAHGRALPVNSDDYPPDICQKGACFVTLKINGRLRGCIGSPEAHRRLFEDVAMNAFGAAFSDPRFNNLTANELKTLDLSISLLSAHTPMNFADEADMISQLRPGIDGLVIADNGRRALFLPSVWEGLADAKNFLAQLKLKAGLGANHWSDNFKAWRFAACEAKASELDSSIWNKGEVI